MANPIFQADLKKDQLLSFGTGGATFARNSVATVFDNEGKLVSLESGVPRFGGGRRVANFVDGVTLPVVIVGNGLVSVSNSVYSLDTISLSASSYRFGNASSGIRGHAYLVGLQLRRLSGAGTISVSLNTAASVNSNPVDAAWISVSVTGAIGQPYRLVDIAVPANNSVELRLIQFEDVTGQADQTASEYVTGTQWFSTNKDGSVIPETTLKGYRNEPADTNNLLWGRDLTNVAWVSPGYGSELIVNGDFPTNTSSWTAYQSTLASVAGQLEVTSTTTGSAQAIQYRTLTVGTRYTILGYVKKGTAESSAALFINPGSGANLTVVTETGGVGITSTGYTFAAVSAGSAEVKCVSTSTSTAKTGYFDNISLKTAEMDATLTATGIDGAANSATVLTALTGNARIWQTLTLAAAARTFSAHVKRLTGTGTISITRDGGATWTDITSQINSSTFTRVKILNSSVLNPQVGFKISTSGDAIAVDYCQDEAGATATSEILTTTAAVTRVADTLTYPTAGNFSDTAGTIVCTKYYDDWGNASGFHVGKTGSGMIASSLNSGVIAQDGTNTVNGPTGTPTGKVRMAIKWSGSTMKVAANGLLLTSGSYDGSFNLTTLGLEGGGYTKEVKVYDVALTDAELINETTRYLGYAAYKIATTTPDRRVGKIIVHNSKATEQHILVFDSAAVPANGAIPVWTAPVPGSSNLIIDFTAYGRRFANGVVVANSSTGSTLTIGEANCWFDVTFTLDENYI